MKRRPIRFLLTAVTSLALAAVGQAALGWYRYGRRAMKTPAGALDRCLPSYEVAEHHATDVAAPADVTYAAALDLRLDRSRLVRGIFSARELLLRGDTPDQPAEPLALRDITRLGWRVVIEEPGRLMVLAAVTQPWEANPRFIGLPLDDFAGFDEPGYVKIAWSIAVEPRGVAASQFITETRVATTDADARRRFRLYWDAFSPGIKLIRREMLRLVRADAEARWRAQSRK